MWDNELKIAREAAVKAGAAIMEIYEGDEGSTRVRITPK